MKKALLVFVVFLAFYSCKQKPDISEIEVIKLDSSLVNEIRNSCDSVKIEQRPTKSARVKYTYYQGKEYENIIFTERSGIITAIIRKQEGINYFVSEYYPNGQMMGKVNLSKEGSVDGFAKYYHSNGRIREIGERRNGKMIGIWKTYDEQGFLISEKNYDKD